MPDVKQFSVIPLQRLVPEASIPLLARSLQAATGLLLFAGHFRSGKSTIAAGTAHFAEASGDTITIVAESPDSFLTHLAVPPTWTVLQTGSSAAEWDRTLQEIDERKELVVLVTSLTQENATAVVNAAKRLRVITCVDTPLVGIDVIYSFTQLGIEQTTLLSVLNCILSQCLVKSLCPSCREPVSLGRNAVQDIAPGTRTTMDVWSEVGCTQCSGTGTIGRRAVSEIIVVDDTTRATIEAAARAYRTPVLPATHYRSMQDAARELLLRGELGVETFRREIAENPVLRATNLLERERDSARTTRELFRRFVDDSVIEAFVDGEEAPLSARRADATCLFCDVRGFTPFSEKHEPQQVFSTLNRLMDEMIALVIKHGGMIDKLVGDSVMALFGLPVAVPDHAVRAARCAIAIQERIERLGEENPEVSELKIGIGINSGELAVGCLGNAQRLEYTVIGDVVNTAARLESMARPRQVLVGSSTRHRLGKAFETRDLGEMSLKGKTEKTRVYELVWISE